MNENLVQNLILVASRSTAGTQGAFGLMRIQQRQSGPGPCREILHFLNNSAFPKTPYLGMYLFLQWVFFHGT